MTTGNVKVGARVMVAVPGTIVASNIGGDHFNVTFPEDLSVGLGHAQAWFPESQLRAVSPQEEANSWRDACADAIRAGRDDEAFAIMVKETSVEVGAGRCAFLFHRVIEVSLIAGDAAANALRHTTVVVRAEDRERASEALSRLGGVLRDALASLDAWEKKR